MGFPEAPGRLGGVGSVSRLVGCVYAFGGRDCSIRAFLQGTLAERLQCGLCRARGPLSTQTARATLPGRTGQRHLHLGLLSSASRCPESHVHTEATQ